MPERTRTASNQIDWQQRSFDFPVGSFVYPFMSGESGLMGRVVAVYPGIGMVDVQWPHGSERVPVEELQRHEQEFFIPPSVEDETVPGGVPEGPQATEPPKAPKQAAGKDTDRDWLPGGLGDETLPADVSSEQLAKGIKVEMEHTDDPAVAREITLDHLTEDPRYYDKLETIEKHAAQRRVAEGWVKRALYWASSDRKYKATDEESGSGTYLCPKCKKGTLRKAVYKRRGGQSEKLLGCSECLFLIKREDIIGDPSYLAPAEGVV